MSLLKRPFGNRVARDAAARGAGVAERVRWGLTGLAAIFLLVLIAAAGLRPARTPETAQGQNEPLAELGVAPGAGPTALTQAPRPPVHNRPSQT